jgi:hypothetical protein
VPVTCITVYVQCFILVNRPTSSPSSCQMRVSHESLCVRNRLPYRQGKSDKLPCHWLVKRDGGARHRTKTVGLERSVCVNSTVEESGLTVS